MFEVGQKVKLTGLNCINLEKVWKLVRKYVEVDYTFWEITSDEEKQVISDFQLKRCATRVYGWEGLQEGDILEEISSHEDWEVKTIDDKLWLCSPDFIKTSGPRWLLHWLVEKYWLVKRFQGVWIKPILLKDLYSGIAPMPLNNGFDLEDGTVLLHCNENVVIKGNRLIRKSDGSYYGDTDRISPYIRNYSVVSTPLGPLREITPLVNWKEMTKEERVLAHEFVMEDLIKDDILLDRLGTEYHVWSDLTIYTGTKNLALSDLKKAIQTIRSSSYSVKKIKGIEIPPTPIMVLMKKQLSQGDVASNPQEEKPMNTKIQNGLNVNDNLESITGYQYAITRFDKDGKVKSVIGRNDRFEHTIEDPSKFFLVNFNNRKLLKPLSLQQLYDGEKMEFIEQHTKPIKPMNLKNFSGGAPIEYIEEEKGDQETTKLEEPAPKIEMLPHFKWGDKILVNGKTRYIYYNVELGGRHFLLSEKEYNHPLRDSICKSHMTKELEKLEGNEPEEKVKKIEPVALDALRPLGPGTEARRLDGTRRFKIVEKNGKIIYRKYNISGGFEKYFEHDNPLDRCDLPKDIEKILLTKINHLTLKDPIKLIDYLDVLEGGGRICDLEKIRKWKLTSPITNTYSGNGEAIGNNGHIKVVKAGNTLTYYLTRPLRFKKKLFTLTRLDYAWMIKTKTKEEYVNQGSFLNSGFYAFNSVREIMEDLV